MLEILARSLMIATRTDRDPRYEISEWEREKARIEQYRWWGRVWPNAQRCER